VSRKYVLLLIVLTTQQNPTKTNETIHTNTTADINTQSKDNESGSKINTSIAGNQSKKNIPVGSKIEVWWDDGIFKRCRRCRC